MKNFSYTLLLITLLFIPSSLMAQSPEDCILHEDLLEISQSFDQFQTTESKTEYCLEDLGEKGLAIAKSLVVLKNMRPNEPALNEDDAFTFKAISEQNWWDYFTKRADTFNLIRQCPEGVIAFVRPFLNDATINLCEAFFGMNISSQASVMMHEVRHFDGHSHVTCSQGMENGNQGACDDKITSKGSYAISVQTLVGMARAENVNVGDKALLEAEAIYMGFNKFNEVPKLRLNKSIILSNQSGEVFKWSIEENSVEAMGVLEKPAMVIRSGGALTIYPLNPEAEAYRKDTALSSDIENPGLYAVHYNSETPVERAKYRSISYFGAGGLLKNNTLINLCDAENKVLTTTELDSYGDVQALINLSTDLADQFRDSYILNTDGELFSYKCSQTEALDVLIEKSPLKVVGGAQRVVRSFGLSGEQYFLMDSGVLTVANIQGENMILEEALSLPIPNQDWVSATPYSLPEVF